MTLKYLPEPDYLEFSLPERHVGLLTDDGSPTTTALAQSLSERGWKVVVLSFPQVTVAQRAPLPQGIQRVVLEDMSEAALQRQLAAIEATYGAIAAFIHLHPTFPLSQNDGVRYLETDKAIVKQVFLMAKHLKQSLNRSAQQGYSCFLTAARLDGAFGFEQTLNFSPISGGLFGLTKSLNQEWKSVTCRAIDLNPAMDAEQSAQAILAELHDPNRTLTEVGYGARGRVSLIA